MNEERRRKLAGGWLRVCLGTLQITLAGAATLLWLSGAGERLIWALAGAALLAVIISRVLYRSK